MDFLIFNSVVIDNVAMLPSIETLPGYDARAAFTVNSASVFREDVDIMPIIVDDTLSYIPWGGDNLQLIDRKPAIVASHLLTVTVVFPKSFTPTGERRSATARRLRKSTCSTRLRRCGMPNVTYGGVRER